MAALITETIPSRNFELVGQAIGAILATEFPGQTTTQNIVVWSERISDFGPEELPAVNVSYSRTSFDNHSVISKRGESQYFVDIHVNAKNSSTSEANKTASISAQKIGGIVEYILSHPRYVTLGFAPGTIGNRLVTDIQIGRSREDDALSTVLCRVTMSVQAIENVSDLTGITIEEIHTSVKLDDTDKGYRFEIIEE